MKVKMFMLEKFYWLGGTRSYVKRLVVISASGELCGWMDSPNQNWIISSWAHFFLEQNINPTLTLLTWSYLQSIYKDVFWSHQNWYLSMHLLILLVHTGGVSCKQVIFIHVLIEQNVLIHTFVKFLYIILIHVHFPSSWNPSRSQMIYCFYSVYVFILNSLLIQVTGLFIKFNNSRLFEKC